MLNSNTARAWFLVLVLFSTKSLGEGCSDTEIPIRFLSQPIGNLVHEFSEIADNRNFLDEVDNEKKDELLLVIWRDLYFLNLYVVDAVVTKLLIDDIRLKTARNIGVGNTLADVRNAYPEAIFTYLVDYRYHADDYSIHFQFDFDSDGIDYFLTDINAESIQHLKLSQITVSGKTSPIDPLYQK